MSAENEQRLSHASELHQGLIDQAKGWVKERAAMIPEDQWPELPKGVRGIELGVYNSGYFHVVLSPDGSVRHYHHATWEFEGVSKDKNYLSRRLLLDIQNATEPFVQGQSESSDQDTIEESGNKVWEKFRFVGRR